MDDIEVNREAKMIRAMSSPDAADWLMHAYPAGSFNNGHAFNLLTRRSWLRGDQVRLADHYLAGIPFASDRPYLIFLSFMSVRRFVAVLRNALPSDKSRLRLLRYHLSSDTVLRAISEQDRAVLAAFLTEIDQPN